MCSPGPSSHACNPGLQHLPTPAHSSRLPIVFQPLASPSGAPIVSKCKYRVPPFMQSCNLVSDLLIWLIIYNYVQTLCMMSEQLNACICMIPEQLIVVASGIQLEYSWNVVGIFQLYSNYIPKVTTYSCVGTMHIQLLF